MRRWSAARLSRLIERNPGKEAESVAEFVKQLVAVSRLAPGFIATELRWSDARQLAYMVCRRLTTERADELSWTLPTGVRKSTRLDRKLVELLNQRAQAAQEIGKLKRQSECRSTSRTASAWYSTTCRQANPGPLPDRRSAADLRAHHGCHARYSAGRNRAEAAIDGSSDTELDTSE